MSIETLLADNTAAIRELIATIKAQAYAEASQPAAPKAPPVAAKPEPKAAKPTPAPAPVVEDTPEAHATPADPETLVTIDEVKAAVLKLAATKGREAAVAVLQSFGAAKAPELKPEQYGDVLAALNAKMAG